MVLVVLVVLVESVASVVLVVLVALAVLVASECLQVLRQDLSPLGASWGEAEGIFTLFPPGAVVPQVGAGVGVGAKPGKVPGELGQMKVVRGPQRAES